MRTSIKQARSHSVSIAWMTLRQDEFENPRHLAVVERGL